MPKRSWVREHYKVYEGGSAACNICAKRIKCDKCTTNLIKHLKVHKVSEVSNVLIPQTEERISLYPGFFFKETNERKKKIDDLILSLIITDLQPFSIVEDKGFVNLIKFLDPKYQLPCRKTLKKWLKEKYAKSVQLVSEELKNIQKVCVTTDSWTSINTDNFLTVTCHYINNNFELISRTLETKKCIGRHTSVAIANHLSDIFEKWHIEGKIGTIVTDNAPNMLAAVGVLNNQSISCFAHALNLIVKNSMKDVKEICELREKCRRLVTYFKTSSQAKDKLFESQTILKTCNHKLIMEVETRWNSTYSMFERINEQRPAIALALSSLKINFEALNDNEWNIIPKLLPLLRPFLLITEEMSTESQVSLSKVIIIKKQLNIFLNSGTDESSIEGMLCMNLRRNVEKYYGRIMHQDEYVITTLLDPRFREFGFTNDTEAKEFLKNVMDDFCNTDINYSAATKAQPVSLEASQINNESSLTYDTSFWTSFDNAVVQINSKTTNVISDVTLEIRKYFEFPLLNRQANPLEFWSENAANFPILSTLVKQYMCTMATSVPAERVFSKAGIIIDKKRSRLSDNIVGKIIFLNNYYKNKGEKE